MNRSFSSPYISPKSNLDENKLFRRKSRNAILLWGFVFSCPIFLIASFFLFTGMDEYFKSPTMDNLLGITIGIGFFIAGLMVFFTLSTTKRLINKKWNVILFWILINSILWIISLFIPIIIYWIIKSPYPVFKTIGFIISGGLKMLHLIIILVGTVIPYVALLVFWVVWRLNKLNAKMNPITA